MKLVEIEARLGVEQLPVRKLLSYKIKIYGMV